MHKYAVFKFKHRLCMHIYKICTSYNLKRITKVCNLKHFFMQSASIYNLLDAENVLGHVHAGAVCGHDTRVITCRRKNI